MIAAKLLCYSHYATDKVKEISRVKYITKIYKIYYNYKP